jgi:hypothetical protein
MPKRDGTGPFGSGPLFGRGRGRCRVLFSMTGNRYTRKAGIIGILVPCIGAVIRDLVNPNSLLRIVSRKLVGTKKSERFRIRNAVKTDYVILDDDKANDQSKKEIKARKQIE